MKYFQVNVITTHEAADIVSLLFIEKGSEGTVIKDGEDLKELYRSGIIWDYIDNSVLQEAKLPVTVIGFFPENFELSEIEPDLEKIKSEFTDCGSLETSLSVIDSKDWENEWKKYYKPIEIGKILIVPKWISVQTELLTVKLDPGMAFGTGNHETTSSCIELMQEIDLANKTVFDVGCGSGILGITASKLGAARVFMSDIDNIATDATKANLSLNSITNAVVLTTDSISDFGTKANIITANITADILMQYRDQFYLYSEPDMKLILSGIIKSRLAELETFFGKKFQTVMEIVRGEWVALLMRKI